MGAVLRDTEMVLILLEQTGAFAEKTIDDIKYYLTLDDKTQVRRPMEQTRQAKERAASA